MKRELLRIEKGCIISNNVKVIDNLRLNVLEGEVLLILSQHNVDLSYVSSVLTGNSHLDSGFFFFNEKEVKIESLTHATKLGIYHIGSESKLVASMSIAHNLFVVLRKAKALINNYNYNMQTREIMDIFDLSYLPDDPVSELSPAERTLIELIKAYRCEAKLVIIDDIFSNYSPYELYQFSCVLKKMQENNISIVMLSHSTGHHLKLANRITIIRDNTNAENLDAKDFDIDKIYKIMIGSKFKDAFLYKTNMSEETVVYIKNVSFPGSTNKINIALKKGEILGIFDIERVISSIQNDSIYNVLRKKNVNILIEGKRVFIKNLPHLKSDIAFFYNQIDRECILNKLSISENIFILYSKRFGKTLFRSNRKICKLLLKDFCSTYNIDEGTPVIELSLLQKYYLILFMWYIFAPKVLVGGFPFTQLDDHTKNLLYPELAKIAHRGTSIILLSSNMTELSSICDNILVLYKDKEIKKYSKKEFRLLQVEDLF